MTTVPQLRTPVQRRSKATVHNAKVEEFRVDVLTHGAKLYEFLLERRDFDEVEHRHDVRKKSHRSHST